MKVIIYSDGSSRGNPGNGGYGTRIEYTDNSGQLHVREYSEGFKSTTNNRMELLGAIIGFEALITPCDVTFISDSQYVIKAFTDNWIPGWVKRGWKNSKGEKVKNRDLWERLIKATKPHNVTFQWIKGHAGHPGNERCDELATIAADNTAALKNDVGFESGEYN